MTKVLGVLVVACLAVCGVDAAAGPRSRSLHRVSTQLPPTFVGPGVTLAIMFKESFQALDMNTLGVTAMVIFFTTFVALGVWVLLQKRDEVSRWSNLPLADDAGGDASLAGVKERP